MECTMKNFVSYVVSAFLGDMQNGTDNMQSRASSFYELSDYKPKNNVMPHTVSLIYTFWPKYLNMLIRFFPFSIDTMLIRAVFAEAGTNQEYSIN